LALDDDYAAYCLDEALAHWGGWIMGEIEKVDGKTTQEITNKQEMLLNKLLRGGTIFAEPRPPRAR